jgi:hypothetical protein
MTGGSNVMIPLFYLVILMIINLNIKDKDLFLAYKLHQLIDEAMHFTEDSSSLNVQNDDFVYQLYHGVFMGPVDGIITLLPPVIYPAIGLFSVIINVLK